MAAMSPMTVHLRMPLDEGDAGDHAGALAQVSGSRWAPSIIDLNLLPQEGSVS